MKAHSRFEKRSLRDVLVTQGVLTNELADELMSSARESNEPFALAVVGSGHMSAWDLAKAVAQHYQLPMIPLTGFTFDKDLVEGISPAVLYQYHVLPVGRFGRVWSFAVIEPPTRDCLQTLEEACGHHLFFFVADTGEVQRLLRAHVKVVDVAGDKTWEALFDSADQSVLDGLTTPEA
jgi:type IV pilus assembly protein PilB